MINEDQFILDLIKAQDLKDEQKQTYSFGCVMSYFSFPNISEIQDKIDPNDLYIEDTDRTFGLEKTPHTTLLYGLHSNEIQDSEVFEKINNINIGTIVLKNVSTFDNEKYDVLKFDAFNENLHKLNNNLKTLPYTSDFPDYHPHSTIAYLKKGKGEKYVKMFKDLQFEVQHDKFIYSKPNGDKIEKAFNDPSHGGKLVKKQIIDKNGHKQTEWVRPDEINKPDKKSKQQDQSSDKKKGDEESEPNLSFIDILSNEDKAKLELIKELIDEGDYIAAKELADKLKDEVKQYIPKEVWKELHIQDQIENNGVKVKEEKEKQSNSDKLFDLLKKDKFKKLDRKKQTKLILDSEQEAILKARKLTQNFTDNEIDALDIYASSSYNDINGYLRDPKNEEYSAIKSSIDSTIKDIDSAISKNVLEEDMIVYRALKDSKELKNDKAYQSTSIDPYSAFNFKRGDGDIFAIKLPKGTNYAYLGGGEKEMLLPRDLDLSKYIVKNELIKKSEMNLFEKGKQWVSSLFNKAQDLFLREDNYDAIKKAFDEDKVDEDVFLKALQNKQRTN